MERCQKLKEYAQFIDIIRHYLRENEQWTNEQAISKAIDDCIQNNILRDILQKERLRELWHLFYLNLMKSGIRK